MSLGARPSSLRISAGIVTCPLGLTLLYRSSVLPPRDGTTLMMQLYHERRGAKVNAQEGRSDHSVLALDRRDVLAVLALLVLAVVCLYPAVQAGFVLVDDHEILAYTPQALADPNLRRPPGLEQVLEEDAANGRIRPMYWVVRYAEIGVLGPRPVAWHALYIALGVACAGLLFATLCGLGISRFPALLGAGWLIVAPGVSTVWIRLGPQESVATLFLLLAAWALARSIQKPWFALAYVVSATAATLTKESFTLVPPALLGLYLLVSHRTQSARLGLVAAVPVLAGGVVLVAAFVAARIAGASSYGGGILDRVELGPGGAMAANLAILAVDGGVVLVVLILGLPVDFARHRRISVAASTWLRGAGLVLLLVIPQLVLYGSGAGFAVGRYILPAGLGLAAGFAAGAHWLRITAKPALFVAAIVLWIAVLAFGALWTRNDADAFLLDSMALDEMVTSITQTAPAGSTIASRLIPSET